MYYEINDKLQTVSRVLEAQSIVLNYHGMKLISKSMPKTAVSPNFKARHLGLQGRKNNNNN